MGKAKKTKAKGKAVKRSTRVRHKRKPVPKRAARSVAGIGRGGQPGGGGYG